MASTIARTLSTAPGAAVLVLAGCGTTEPQAAVRREPPPQAELRSLPPGERIGLPLAELFVPAGFAPAESGDVPLFVHFQGGVPIALRNFARSGRPGVLIASTLAGLSSAFRKPYEDPATFRALLDEAERKLAERCGRAVRLRPLTITFFSAGYGAVRELLKHDDLYERIAALVSADSIYADVVAPAARAPVWEQMAGFVRFAQDAARGTKTFVLAHSAIRTPYASTAETAELLLAAVAARRRTADGEVLERGIPIATRADAGGFHLYGFAEDTPGIHVDLLWAIPELVRRHLPAR